MFGLYDVGSQLLREGNQLNLTLSILSSNSLKISWSIPKNKEVYYGVVITLSTSPINQSNYPTNGIKYIASTDFGNPIHKIGKAVVVGAFYNDDITTEITVNNVDADNEIYYASAHICNNVLNYHDLGTKSYAEEISTDIYAPSIERGYEPPETPDIGQVYYDEKSNKTLMWSGAAWVNAGNGTTLTGKTLPEYGEIGQFFYIIPERKLYVWSGDIWKPATKDDEKKPIYLKTGIGTDRTYDERAGLISVLKTMLGWPTQCLELKDNHFNVSIDNALQELRQRSESAYRPAFIAMRIHPNQQVYYLNNPELETDKVASIIRILRAKQGPFLYSGDGSNAWNQAFASQLFTMGTIDFLTIHLTASYLETLNTLFAGNIQFTWREATRELTIYRKIPTPEIVLLECALDRTEQELLTDRFTNQWIQGWALSELKMILGHIRTKFGSIPGPNGGITMNGDTLFQQAREDQTELLRQLQDFEVGNIGEFGATGIMIG